MLGLGVETLGRIHEKGFYVVTASVDWVVDVEVELNCALKLGPDLSLTRQRLV